MPEIAEVRRYVDQLSAEYGGQDLLDVEIVGGRFLKEGIDALNLLTFPMYNAKFNAKGKFIYLDLDDPSVPMEEGGKTYFFITLGMSASFGRENKHSAVKFTFSNGTVFYNDIRHFGTIKVGLNENELNRKLNSIGWDCLLEPNIPDNLIPKLRKKNHKTISEVMLDQKIYGGLGNYLRSEILYASRIDPFRKIQDLSDDDLIRIASNYIKIAHEAYKYGGATIATYSDLYGNVGSFYDQFKVYGKKKDLHGHNVIRAEAPDGRTVHYVKEIQL